MIAIINYNTGNIKSVANALKKLGFEYAVTSDPLKIKNADKVILPGVGGARFAMEQLKKLGLVNTIKNLKQPVLGICLGMQILMDYSEEGGTKCLGIIQGKVKKFNCANLKVPHIGWNSVEALQGPLPNRLLLQIPPAAFSFKCGSRRKQAGALAMPEKRRGKLSGFQQQNAKVLPYFYFVHSYYAPIGKYTIGKTEYGIEFSSIITKDNFYGVQFHPEKSGRSGLNLLRQLLI